MGAERRCAQLESSFNSSQNLDHLLREVWPLSPSGLSQQLDILPDVQLLPCFVIFFLCASLLPLEGVFQKAETMVTLHISFYAVHNNHLLNKGIYPFSGPIPVLGHILSVTPMKSQSTCTGSWKDNDLDGCQVKTEEEHRRLIQVV